MAHASIENHVFKESLKPSVLRSTNTQLVTPSEEWLSVAILLKPPGHV